MALGGNPCLEQTLEDHELCNLVETFPYRVADEDEMERVARAAFFMGKVVSLCMTHHTSTNAVISQNRRVGLSMTGIQQVIVKMGRGRFANMCDRVYAAVQEVDAELSEWFGVPRSIKTTSVKPSGTLSCLGGCSSGLHYPEAEYYIRRVRISGHLSELIARAVDAGHVVEDSAIPYPVSDAERAAGEAWTHPAVINGRYIGKWRGERVIFDPATKVIEFPVHFDLGGDGVRKVPTKASVPVFQKLADAALLQRVWADNQVSVTVDFDPKTEGPMLEGLLDHFQYHLKGVSFLPRMPLTEYPQLPFETITKQQYDTVRARICPIDFSSMKTSAATAVPVKSFCDGDKCEEDRPVIDLSVA
jgi:ribonucleoside-triphosphate reductase (thioredoxin)